MKQIHTVSSAVLPFDAGRVWRCLTDVASYPLWWPRSIKVKVINATEQLLGSKIEIRPYGGMPFYCEFVGCASDAKLVMSYSGLYSGVGVWTLTRTDGLTKVDYEINLEIKSRFVRLLSYVMPIDKIHSKLMDEVLLGLENRLKGGSQ